MNSGRALPSRVRNLLGDAILYDEWGDEIGRCPVYEVPTVDAGGGDRTPTSSRSRDFESRASTSSATPANEEANP